MSVKKSNRGGARPGAGRKPAFDVNKATGEVTDNYKPKINVLKEYEKLYKQLEKITSKEELLIIQAKLDLLNKMSPYVVMKKPTASLEENKEVIPDMTILKVIEGGETEESAQKEEQKTPIEENDEEDFV